MRERRGGGVESFTGWREQKRQRKKEEEKERWRWFSERRVVKQRMDDLASWVALVGKASPLL